MVSDNQERYFNRLIKDIDKEQASEKLSLSIIASLQKSQKTDTALIPKNVLWAAVLLFSLSIIYLLSTSNSFNIIPDTNFLTGLLDGLQAPSLSFDIQLGKTLTLILKIVVPVIFAQFYIIKKINDRRFKQNL